MFGSVVIDVAIGLTFIYFLLSLVCAALNEVIESFLKNRARDLERGLRELLNDRSGTGLVKQVYSHPLISGLFAGEYTPGAKDLPSYIPSRNFALALMDLVCPGAAATGAQARSPSGAAGATSPAAPQANPLETLRASVSKIDNPAVERALIILIDAAGTDARKARENIETWFDSCMERVAGWYKRRSHKIILGLGVGLAVLLNVDSLTIARSLSVDKGLREAVVAASQGYREPRESPAGPKEGPAKGLRAAVEEISTLNLPIGWSWTDPRLLPPLAEPADALPWLTKVFGWILTAGAISLGAPFWFDLLSKFVTVRSTVKPAEKSQEGEPESGERR